MIRRATILVQMLDGLQISDCVTLHDLKTTIKLLNKDKAITKTSVKPLATLIIHTALYRTPHPKDARSFTITLVSPMITEG